MIGGNTMMTREDICGWVVEALRALGGSSRIVPICKYIWDHYEAELRSSGDIFYPWQYDVRWAGQQLRDQGILTPVNNKRNTPWELKKK